MSRGSASLTAGLLAVSLLLAGCVRHEHDNRHDRLSSPPPPPRVVVAEPPPPVVVAEPPPPPLIVERAPAPRPGYLWIAGHWSWDGRRYGWVKGRWERPPHADARWVAPHYDPAHRHYRPGHWVGPARPVPPPARHH